MNRTLAVRTAVLGALLGGAAGCFRAPIDPPAIPLDRTEQRAVLACQQTINRGSAQLHATATRQFQKCADRLLRLRLDEERDLNSLNIAEFVARRGRSLEQCADGYGRIGDESTRMIDAILRNCGPVEDLILGDPARGDPLAVKSEPETSGISLLFDVETVADLASFECGFAIVWAEMLISSTHARSGDLAQRYDQIDEEEEFQQILRGFLDPRCRVPEADL
jgi:hypothetical protein